MRVESRTERIVCPAGSTSSVDVRRKLLLFPCDTYTESGEINRPMTGLRKPPRVTDGSTVAVVAPSSTATASFEHRMDAAVEFLTDRGYEVTEAAATRHDGAWRSTDAAERASAFTDAFLDPSVDLILTAIGGVTANTLLPHLPFDALRANPTAVCGYSDITAIHYGLLSQAGVVTFYGPCAVTEFGEYPEPFAYTVDSFVETMRGDGTGVVEPSPEWTDEVLDWEQQLDTVRRRDRRPNPGYEWLREGTAEGPLLGGCLPTLSRLVGTRFWPDHDGAILLLDIPEGRGVGVPISVAEVHSALVHLSEAGVFDAVSGVVVSRPPHADAETRAELKRLLRARTTGPIVYGVDGGHTDPQATLPLGTRVGLDSEAGTLRRLESGTKPT